MRYAHVIKLLAAHKGDGTWAQVARSSDIRYDTLARIARGDIPSPSVQIVEKISDALVRLFPAECGQIEAEV